MNTLAYGDGRDTAQAVRRASRVLEVPRDGRAGRPVLVPTPAHPGLDLHRHRRRARDRVTDPRSWPRSSGLIGLKPGPNRDELVKIAAQPDNALMALRTVDPTAPSAEEPSVGEPHTPNLAFGGVGANGPPVPATTDGDEPTRWVVSVSTNMGDDRGEWSERLVELTPIEDAGAECD